MLKLLITISVFCFSAHASATCKIPNSDELRTFFKKKTVWKKFGAKITIDFDNPNRSKLNSLKGSDQVKSFKLCGNQLHVVTEQGLKGTLTIKNRKLSIKSKEGNHTLANFNNLAAQPFQTQQAIEHRAFSPRYYRERALYSQPIRQPASAAIDI